MVVDDKVFLLSGAILPPDQVYSNVVNLLEDLLVRAKKGEVHSIGVAFVDGGDFPNTDWALGYSRRDSHLLMSGVGLLLHRMQSISIANASQIDGTEGV